MTAPPTPSACWRQACTTLDRRARAATLYSSAEPCAMCAGAIYWAGIGRLVYGLSEHRLRGVTGNHPKTRRSICPAASVQSGQRATEVIGPLLEDEAEALHEGVWTQVSHVAQLRIAADVASSSTKIAAIASPVTGGELHRDAGVACSAGCHAPMRSDRAGVVEAELVLPVAIGNPESTKWEYFAPQNALLASKVRRIGSLLNSRLGTAGVPVKRLRSSCPSVHKAGAAADREVLHVLAAGSRDPCSS